MRSRTTVRDARPAEAKVEDHVSRERHLPRSVNLDALLAVYEISLPARVAHYVTHC